MKQFKVIEQLKLIDGELKCKTMSGRAYQKAHYKQGDLDGACGAYSVAMAMNILGVLDADDIYDSSRIDKRTTYGKLIKTLNEGNGLYPDGLFARDIRKILLDNYSKCVDVRCVSNNKKSLIEKAVDCINDNTPIIIGIRFNKHDGHWIVIIGYEIDEDDNIVALLALDPGSNSPVYSYWNGYLDLRKIPHKTYAYTYTSDYTKMVLIDDGVIITPKKANK